MTEQNPKAGFTLPEIIPVFPLPNVVLFPSTVLPLHIFEPRYRKMVQSALETDRMIVMALLKPGSEADYFGSPPLFSVGCVGQIVTSTKLPDGRYDIVLTGLTRVEIVEEVGGGDFRRARVVARPEERDWIESDGSALEIRKLLRRFQEVSGSVQILSSGVDLEGEVAAREISLNTMALHLDAPPTLRQKLLETESLKERAALIARYLLRSMEERHSLESFRHLAPDDPRVN